MLDLGEGDVEGKGVSNVHQITWLAAATDHVHVLTT